MAKILVAPASYKGSITAHNLAAAIVRGCQDLDRSDMHQLYADAEIVAVPIADGGDDTLLSLHLALGGELIDSDVIGPTGQSVRAAHLQLPNLAVIELAQASGIAYLNTDQLQPLTAHTYGTGQLIGRAIAGGATKIVVTLGGSASTDGGTGALSAIGAKFLDKSGVVVPLGGGSLLQIAAIDLSELFLCTRGVEFIIATDVVSPLLGGSGAAAVFGPQKGASPADVALLEAGLAHFAAMVEEKSGIDPQLVAASALLPGSGSAGGAGFGFAAMLKAPIVSGFHFLADLLALNQKIEWCDLIIVAEGKLDKQSLSGKGVGEIISLAARLGKTVLALPARSDLTAGELAAFLNLPDFSTIVVVATGVGSQNGIASLADVQAATTRALEGFRYI